MWTETEVSKEGKTFTVTPKNIDSGVIVIIAFYNGDALSEAYTAEYNGVPVPYVAEKQYDAAKVMIWEDMINRVPICKAENVEF